MSELLGFDLSSIDFDALMRRAVEFSLPRLGESLLLLLLTGVIYTIAHVVLRRVHARLSAGNTEPRVQAIAAELVRSALLASVAFWGLWRLAQIWELGQLANVIGGLWLIALTLPASKAASALLGIVEKQVASRTETKIDDTALPWVKRVVRWGIIAAGVMVAAYNIGLNITPLLAGAGVAGIALSFAAQDTLSNLIAGILLIMDRPFEVGDRIEIWSAPARQATWGDVIEIGIRATKIRTPDNILIVIPNSEIMKRDIVNYTATGDSIRLRIPIGIAYDADVDTAKKLCLDVADACEGVLETPRPVCILRAFGASSVDLELRVWLVKARARRDVEDWITEKIKRAFDEAGIEIPYPKRDLYIRQAPNAAVLAPESRARSDRAAIDDTDPGGKHG